MNKFILTLIISFVLSINAFAQTERYVYINKGGYNSDWIKFFDNGRFELIHDEQCYAYSNGVGIFSVFDNFIQLDFFESFASKKEIIEKQSSDEKVNVFVQVYSLQDSSIITTATIFARDTTRQTFDFNEKVDANGSKNFVIPKGNTIKYMRVYADNYNHCVIFFDEKYDNDYYIKIYLSEDPLQNRNYKGVTNKREKIIRKGNNKIVYEGKTYKKVE